MIIINKECISLPARDINEDIAFINNYAAWILDGATGLSRKNLVDTESDAKWFVEQWDEYLKKNIMKWNMELKDIVSEGIKQINNNFHTNLNDSQKSNLQSIDLPSSTIALIRWDKNYIDYLLLGDCTLMFKNNNNEIKYIKDETLDHLDGIVIEFMTREKKKNSISHIEARELAMDLLVKHRSLKNKPNGYWSLGFSKESAEKAKVGKEKLEKESKILLMSDGFSILFNKYTKVKKEEIFDIIEQEGLKSCYKLIREIEDNDPECIQYPRLKKSDDSSAIFIVMK